MNQPLGMLFLGLAGSVGEHRAELRAILREYDVRKLPRALRPLPYSDPLGPTGNPKTYGIVGGGNHSGTASPGSHTRAYAKKNGRLPSAYWDPTIADQNRQFENLRKQRSRIKANGGKRKPQHRPRTITAEQEQQVRDELARGTGINKTAKLVGIGISGVQRVKSEMT